MRRIMLGVCLLVGGCATAGAAGFGIKLVSPAFQNGAPIPRDFTCEGSDRSPPLELAQRPMEMVSWALVVDDMDAPGGRFTHFVIWNIPGDQRRLDTGQPKDQLRLANGAIQGKNDFGKVGWSGPCPPPGQVHHYRFHVYALDGLVQLPPAYSASDLERAIHFAGVFHNLGEGTLIGTYARDVSPPAPVGR